MLLTTSARNAAADAIAALLNGGTLEFQTSGDVEVATLTFGSPAFGAASVGVATANAIARDDSATGGVIAKAVLKTSLDADVMTLTVTAIGGGGDVELTNLTIVATEPLELNDFTLTMPAS